MLSRRSVPALLAVVALSLLMIAPVIAQEEVSATQVTPPAPPAAVPGSLWLTSVDNEDNFGNGVADQDMGYPNPPQMFNGDRNHPIEFLVTVPRPVV